MSRSPAAARKPGAIVSSVRPGSIADEAGLRPGDELIAVNGQPPSDVIAFHHAATSTHLTLAVRRPDGTRLVVEVEKAEDEELGLSFTDPLFDRIVTCENRCVFCFVHQSPKGMRRTLYLMDDDYRLSMLDGNFITLTNWTEADWQRVIEQHLSPLYISVHSTDDDLRSFLMGTPKARGILAQLRRLAQAGIVLHTQLVLCPGLNDGPHLDRSLADLSRLFPAVRSIGVVPVGLTRFRRGLYPLRPYRPDEARSVLRQVHRWQRRFVRDLGTRLAYAADEWYVLAGRPVPAARAYEGFPQLENGIGLIRKLTDQARGALSRLPRGLEVHRRVLWVTGRSAYATLSRLAAALTRRIAGLAIEVQAVENRFYGPTVTVAGLLTGQDLQEALARRPDLHRWDAVLLPAVTLKADAPVFLDNMTFAQLRDATTPALQVVPVDGRALVRACIGTVSPSAGSLTPSEPDAAACPLPARRSRPGLAP